VCILLEAEVKKSSPLIKKETAKLLKKRRIEFFNILKHLQKKKRNVVNKDINLQINFAKLRKEKGNAPFSNHLPENPD
jgi:hypothetical protein